MTSSQFSKKDVRVMCLLDFLGHEKVDGSLELPISFGPLDLVVETNGRPDEINVRSDMAWYGIVILLRQTKPQQQKLVGLKTTADFLVERVCTGDGIATGTRRAQQEVRTGEISRDDRMVHINAVENAQFP